MSRKNTKSAERIRPTPRLNTIRQQIGIIRLKNPQVNVIPSKMQKIKNTASVNPKLIRAETFLENKNKYLGTFIFVKISAFPRSEPIPPLVESVKNAVKFSNEKLPVLLVKA
jgi:hypothetical protein